MPLLKDNLFLTLQHLLLILAIVCEISMHYCSSLNITSQSASDFTFVSLALFKKLYN